MSSGGWLGRVLRPFDQIATPGDLASAPDGEAARQPLRFISVVAACAATTLVSVALRDLLDPVNLVMLYLLTVVLLTVRFGRSAGVLASFVAVVAFDIFLIPPYNSLSVADTEYVLTFFLMLTVALIVSALTASLRQQMLLARARERRSMALFELSQQLSGASTLDEIGQVGLRHLATLIPGEAFLLFSGGERALRPAPGSPPAGAHLLPNAQRIFDCLPAGGSSMHGVNLGNVLYLPLQAPGATQGMLVLAVSGQRASQEQERLAQTVAAQIGLAAERVQLVEVAQERRLSMESERLRNSLLSAISHDVRTPLTAIAGMASALNDSPLPEPVRRELLQSIEDNALRMRKMVQNMLDMAKLQAGRVVLRREWQMLEEVAGSALAQLSTALAPMRVEVSIPAAFPLLCFDAVLIERVLFNLLDNAAKYAPAGSRIRIAAATQDSMAVIAVEDDGPGLAPDMEREAFLKFRRGPAESPDAGAGLGLSICQAIIEAHEGQIRAENRDEGGARFTFTLPLGTPPEIEGLRDAR